MVEEKPVDSSGNEKEVLSKEEGGIGSDKNWDIKEGFQILRESFEHAQRRREIIAKRLIAIWPKVAASGLEAVIKENADTGVALSDSTLLRCEKHCASQSTNLSDYSSFQYVLPALPSTYISQLKKIMECPPPEVVHCLLGLGRKLVAGKLTAAVDGSQIYPDQSWNIFGASYVSLLSVAYSINRYPGADRLGMSVAESGDQKTILIVGPQHTLAFQIKSEVLRHSSSKENGNKIVQAGPESKAFSVQRLASSSAKQIEDSLIELIKDALKEIDPEVLPSFYRQVTDASRYYLEAMMLRGMMELDKEGIFFFDGPLSTGFAAMYHPAIARIFNTASDDLLKTARNTGAILIGYVDSPASSWLSRICSKLIKEEGDNTVNPPYINNNNLHENNHDNSYVESEYFPDILFLGQLLNQLSLRTPFFIHPAHEKIAFCYMNTGRGIARIEMEISTATSEHIRAEALKAVIGECIAGNGYPLVLQKVHDKAVLNMADRSFFYSLLHNALQPRTNGRAGSENSNERNTIYNDALYTPAVSSAKDFSKWKLF